MKIKKAINQVFDKYKLICQKYPVTLVNIIILTIISVIFINDVSDTIEKMIQFFVFFSIGSLFTEIFFDKKKRLFSYLIFAILSIIFVLIINSIDNIVIEIGNRVVITYILSLLIICLYKLYKNSKLTLPSYLITMFSNVFKTTIIYGVLALGLLLITEAFVYLILNNYDYDIFLRIQILLLGLFYIPKVLDDISFNKSKTYQFIKILIRYTLLSLIILAFVIIYFYIIKIIITWDFPSNQVFRILACVFIFYLPIWIMNKYYDKDDILGKINNKLPIFFGPFIILQIYSLVVRIINNGFTNIRYIGVMLIIFEIIHLIIFFQKKKDDILFYTLIIIIFFSFLLPFVNMYNISCMSQARIIDKLLLKKGYNIEEKNKLYGAYSYLDSSYTGKKYLDKYSDDTKKMIESLKIYYNDYHYISASKTIYQFDIANYNTLNKFDYYDNIDDSDNIILNNNGVSINITNVIKEYLENSSMIDDYFYDHNEYINDDKKIVFEYVRIEYKNNTINSLNIGGYILSE